MSVLDNTRPASFKGVPFLVSRSRTKAGINRAEYLYINTGRRVTKPLGTFPAQFTIEAFTHSIDGDEYEQKRDALRAALDDDKNGTLVHPFLGNAYVCSGLYEFEENFTEVGICRFSLAFKVCDKDENPITPENKRANSAQIKDLALAANRSLQAASAAAFEVSTPLNNESSKSIFESAFDSFRDVFAPLADTLEKFNEYAGKALAAQQQASFYANNPTVGFAALADGVLGVDGLTIDTLTKFRAMQRQFGFGNSGTKYSVDVTSPVYINENPATNEDAERNTNALILKQFVQAAATIESFAQAGNGEYATVDEVNEAAAILKDQLDIMGDALTAKPENEIYDFDLPTPDYAETYEGLKDTATATFQYLDQQRLSAPRVETITTASVPASVLAYTLYGDSTRSQEIMDLNPFTDNMDLSGEVKVLSE